MDNKLLKTSRSKNSHSFKGLLNGSFVLPLCLFILVIVIGIIPRILRHIELSQIHEKIKTDVPSVPAVIAQQAENKTTLLLPGDTQPIQNIPIYARVNGYLSKRLVDIGDIVKSGELLATIDTPELDQQVRQARANWLAAKANLTSAISNRRNYAAALLAASDTIKQARTNLDYSKIEIKRYEDLAKQGAVAWELRDQWLKQYNSDLASLKIAEENENSAAAQVASANALITSGEQNVESTEANLKQLKALQTFQKVTAPSDGIITDRLVDAGALVAAGGAQGTTQLLTMANTDTLRIYVDVPQSDYRYIHNGDKADILLQEFPGRVFQGTVTNIAGGLNSISRTLQTEIRINNKSQILRPGAYTQVRFVFNRENPPVMIPSNAMITKNDGPYVALVADGKVQFRRIDICRDYGNQLEICDGIKPKDIILINTPDNLKDGDQVEAVVATTDKSVTK